MITINESALAPTGSAYYCGMPAYPRHVELYKLLQWFAHAERIEWTHMFKERILVLGDDRSPDNLVQWLRRGGLRAFGIEERPTRRNNYVRGSFLQMPFMPEVFHLTCGFDLLLRFQDTDFPSVYTRDRVWKSLVEETWRTLEWNGYFIVGLNNHRVFHAMLEDRGFLRLPVTMDGLSIYHKFRKDDKILPFYKAGLRKIKGAA